ncbi:AbrB/MazE/SpoVT family DNA-binding domain-containing protein [Novosphingobium sp. 11B]|uniref:AbrB/MazE/SpoVT family DNA-binding domain-containing protein n=1 Tax=Novosphingobium sp. fls2-241-R2A-195 TaxID=3040296 RepID=UPI0025513373|nr:AbrB/MazE/SpoVT family DNA-binding domain-containing protein [Novosphingobium sp. fls2-241-R2A-195]
MEAYFSRQYIVERVLMQVIRWGNSLAICLPTAVVETLALKEGDDIEVRVSDDRALTVDRAASRAAALEHIRRLRRTWPPGWTFDREDANERDC